MTATCLSYPSPYPADVTTVACLPTQDHAIVLIKLESVSVSLTQRVIHVLAYNHRPFAAGNYVVGFFCRVQPAARLAYNSCMGAKLRPTGLWIRSWLFSLHFAELSLLPRSVETQMMQLHCSERNRHIAEFAIVR